MDEYKYTIDEETQNKANADFALFAEKRIVVLEAQNAALTADRARLVATVAELANQEVWFNEFETCILCGRDDSKAHEGSCPVVRAAALLAELDTEGETI